MPVVPVVRAVKRDCWRSGVAAVTAGMAAAGLTVVQVVPAGMAHCGVAAAAPVAPVGPR